MAATTADWSPAEVARITSMPVSGVDGAETHRVSMRLRLWPINWAAASDTRCPKRKVRDRV